MSRRQRWRGFILSVAVSSAAFLALSHWWRESGAAATAGFITASIFFYAFRYFMWARSSERSPTGSEPPVDSGVRHFPPEY